MTVDARGATLLDRLLGLGLPLDDYAVFGSGPLIVRGIVPAAADLDIVCRGAAWDKAREAGDPVHLPEHDVTVYEVDGGDLSFGNVWAYGDIDLDKLIDTAEIIDGIPFAKLHYLRIYKKILNRPKDIEHLAALDAWEHNPTTVVRAARSDVDYALAEELMREYIDWLPFELTFQDFEAEMGRIQTEYGRPTGVALLAEVGAAPVGVAAVRAFEDGVCELKRMWVRETGRRTGAGRALTIAAIAAAKRLGYQRMRLDTIHGMEAANHLYDSLGFVEISPYRHNPQPDARYLELAL